MECERCKQPIPEGEECNYCGKVLCEDCYIQAIEPLRTCDVVAVHSAKTHREMLGQTGTEGLMELQKNILGVSCIPCKWNNLESNCAY